MTPSPSRREVPSLDAVAETPTLAEALPPATVVELYRRAARLTAELHALVLALALDRDTINEPDGADQLLTVGEAAKLLATSPDWLYRHAAGLPFAVRLGRHVRFSAQKIALYLRQRRGK